MASNLFDSNNPVFQQLEQTRQAFWTSTAQLSEGQRQHLWAQVASVPNNGYGCANGSMVNQIPRSMLSDSNMTQLPVWTHLWSLLSLSNAH